MRRQAVSARQIDQGEPPPGMLQMADFLLDRNARIIANPLPYSASAVNNVDLPVFGLPTKATVSVSGEVVVDIASNASQQTQGVWKPYRPDTSIRASYALVPPQHAPPRCDAHSDDTPAAPNSIGSPSGTAPSTSTFTPGVSPISKSRASLRPTG